jgi:hypothetical protein
VFQHVGGDAVGFEGKSVVLHSVRLIFLGCDGSTSYPSCAMTRSSIELSIKIFLVALIVVFIWTVFQVIGMLF